MPTYGNAGNRWWVGLNVGSDQSTILGTGSILSPNGYESLPSGNASDDRQFAAAAAHNKGASKPNTISVENVSWFNINGPFVTQAQANAALNAIASAHPAPGEFQQVTAGGQPGAANGGGINISSWGDALVDIEKRVTDPQWWLRVGEFAIGALLILSGVLRLTGGSGDLKDIAKVAKFA